MYKAFSWKVDALDAQMVKLKTDMEAKTAKLSLTKTPALHRIHPAAEKHPREGSLQGGK